MNIRIGEFIFDSESRELLHGARVRRLEPKAAAVLARLARGPARTVRRSELLDACWPSGEGSDEALTQAIAQVRRAFGRAPGAAQYIQTVARTGYRLKADVDPAPAPHDALAPAAHSISAARSVSGVAPLWLAFVALVLTFSVAALTIGPHGVRHWLMHGSL